MGNPPGQQPLTDIDYEKFLSDMSPFLKLGETLNAAIDDANLRQHRTAIYDKYRLKDWFGEQIDTYREYPGKLANNVLVKFVIKADEKIKQDLPVSEDEMKNVRFYAEKSRSAQPYFVNRTEVAEGKSVADVLRELEEPDTVDDVAENIEKEEQEEKKEEEQNVGTTASEQVVATDPPVQNQEQTGQPGDVQAEPNATPVS